MPMFLLKYLLQISKNVIIRFYHAVEMETVWNFLEDSGVIVTLAGGDNFVT